MSSVIPKLGNTVKTKSRGKDFDGIIISIDHSDPETVMIMWPGVDKSTPVVAVHKDMYTAVWVRNLVESNGQWSLPDDSFSF